MATRRPAAPSERPITLSLKRATQPQRQVRAAPPSAAPAPAAAPTAILRLTTTPVLGDLYVDGKRAGSSFQPAMPLAPGHHEIRIVRDGYEPLMRAFDVVAGDTVKLLQLPLQPTHP